jgi:uncharacterized protein (TIGR03905 family)
MGWENVIILLSEAIMFPLTFPLLPGTLLHNITGGRRMRISYETAGSCAKRIDIEIEAGVIVGADFIDGCPGNTKAVSALVKVMPVIMAVQRLGGITCQGDTSCPDQLARALEATVNQC